MITMFDSLITNLYHYRHHGCTLIDFFPFQANFYCYLFFLHTRESSYIQSGTKSVITLKQGKTYNFIAFYAERENAVDEH